MGELPVIGADTDRHAFVDSVLGEMLLVASGENLTGVYFKVPRPAPEKADPRVKGVLVSSSLPLFAEAASQLNAFLAGKLKYFDLPVLLPTRGFASEVIACISQIPYGKTVTYGKIAADLGAPGAARAVGRAAGANPLLLIVPCHRVIGAGGKITGYAGGLERKRFLLAMEAGAWLREG